METSTRPGLPWAVALFLSACSANPAASGPPDAIDGLEGPDGPDAGPAAPDAALPAARCQGAADACLSGTVIAPGFDSIAGATVTLYASFPAFGQARIVQQAPVEADGSFALSDLPPSDHYFISAGPLGSAAAVEAMGGPFTVPAAAGRIRLEVDRFTAAQTLEQTRDGKTSELIWAMGTVFDASGALVTDAQFTLVNGAQSTRCPWTATLFQSEAYWNQFPPATVGSGSYALRATGGALGPATLTGSLQRRMPAAAPTLDEPVQGSTVAPGAKVKVSWPTNHGYDYVFVMVLRDDSPIWYSKSTTPDAAEVTIPANILRETGDYQVEVAFSTANCVGSGCAYVGYPVTRGVTVQ